uniref:U65-Liphistoxin-Lsp1a_1 n=1 Tax=Liphistius sp. SGP-2016 TaxID=1905180 RepID=A0A4Q8K4Q4_9ARAC
MFRLFIFLIVLHQDSLVSTLMTPSPDDPCSGMGGFQFRETCYLVFEDTFDVIGAMEDCFEKDGDLVIIEDVAEQLFLNHLMSNADTHFWISLFRERNGVFYWMGGKPLTYTNWGRNQPGLPMTFLEYSLGSECFAMSSSGLWYADDCRRSHSYICEVNQGHTFPPPVEPLQGSCPANSQLWEDIGDRYCYMFTAEATQWQNANEKCSQKGGNLASIHTTEELKGISEYVNKSEPFFIGLTRNSHGGFAWTDGSPVNMVRWEENGTQSNLNCIEMRADTSNWKIVNCDESRGFLCSIEKEIVN